MVAGNASSGPEIQGPWVNCNGLVVEVETDLEFLHHVRPDDKLFSQVFSDVKHVNKGSPVDVYCQIDYMLDSESLLTVGHHKIHGDRGDVYVTQRLRDVAPDKGSSRASVIQGADSVAPFRVPITVYSLMMSPISAYPSRTAMPPIRSSSSLVMLSWRSLFITRVRSSPNCLALSVAFRMATMRADCSLAMDSRRA